MNPCIRQTVWIAACMLASTISGGQEASRTFQLSGRVFGASAKNPVYVALWNEDGFLTKPIEQVRIETNAERSFHFKVHAGRWALSAFEDRNGNGILDMGLFGPHEPSGFWRAFAAHHKPRFDEVASVVERDTPNADIVLK